MSSSPDLEDPILLGNNFGSVRKSVYYYPYSLSVTQNVILKIIWSVQSNMTVFLVLWLIFTLLITILGLILILSKKSVPPLLSSAYKYGKLLENLSKGERRSNLLMKTLSIPKRYFSHFYRIAIILHLLSLTIRYYCKATSNCEPLINFLGLIFGNTQYDGINGNLFFVLSLIHLTRRLIETTFVSMPSPAKINIIHYLTGILFYISVSLFNLNNLLTSSDISPSNSLVLNIGLMFFVSGQIIQFQSHSILAYLRKINHAWISIKSRNVTKGKSKGKSKSTVSFGNLLIVTNSPVILQLPRMKRDDYHIPVGKLFNYVSSPNYFAEILIYTGLWFLTNFNRNWFALLVWVISNQTVAALLNHNWYLERFKEYPKKRKALIPFII